MDPCLQLALRWQGHNDVVMFTDYLPGENVEKNLRSMADRAPCPLVIMKAWETVQWAPQVPEEAEVFKKSPRITWLYRSESLDKWLGQKQGLSAERRKTYGLFHLPPSIVWQPLVQTKADKRKKEKWPRWVKNAHCAALFILKESSVPLTTVEVAEKCKHVYTERTIRNALERLRDGGHATAMGALNQRRCWLLSSRGLERCADLSRINQHRA
jgi:hypothetical protein